MVGEDSFDGVLGLLGSESDVYVYWLEEVVEEVVEVVEVERASVEAVVAREDLLDVAGEDFLFDSCLVLVHCLNNIIRRRE